MFIILATISLTGIVVIQIFWVKKAFDLKEKQFNQTMHIALKNVAENILLYNNNPSSLLNPVNQVSSNYYIVKVNDMIDAYTLELYLKNEFEHKGISLDFEYGIYDCSNEEMVYGNYVSADESINKNSSRTALPKWSSDNYYFGVYFPTREEYLLGQMDIWIFSSIVLLIVLIFFAYTIFMIMKQRRLSEIQKDFINNMTHEFKTPISTIAISSEILMKPEIINQPERLLNYASIIHSENSRLKKQVERVLQMATLDKEEIRLDKNPLDLNELIQKIVRNMHAALRQKDGVVSFQLDEMPVVINADNVHLSNIIYNLIDNAIKYAKEKPEITISTKAKKNHVVIGVEDKGIGINKDSKKLIFNKFYRVSTGNIHDVKGFGLGLNYVKIMVNAHKGKIKLESELNKGSKFSILLPYS